MSAKRHSSLLRLSSPRLSNRLRWNALGFVLGWMCIIAALVGLGQRVHLDLTALVRPRSRAGQAPPPRRVRPPASLVSTLRALPVAETAAPPLVLTYHDVDPHPRSPFSITPVRLQKELLMLRAAGYQPIDPSRLLAWLLHGRRLPPRSVLLTFDDGLASAWRYADPILRNTRFIATSFLITGHLDSGSYYMTTPEVMHLAQTGRWTFEAHTSHGHEYISTGPGGAPSAFLVGRRWLSALHRQETYPEFAARIRGDTKRALAWFSAHGLPRPKLFAYPFSAASSPDRRATRISARILGRAFEARFLDDDEGLVTTAAEVRAHLLNRLDVLGTDSLRRFADEVRAATPVTPGQMELLAGGMWARGSGSGRISVAASGITLEPRRSNWLAAALAPTRSVNWGSYRVAARVFLPDSSDAAGISVPSRPGPAASVSVSPGWFEVHLGADRKAIAEGRLTMRGNHWLRVVRDGASVVFTIDGTRVARAPVGSARGGPSLFVDGPPSSRVEFSQIQVRS